MPYSNLALDADRKNGPAARSLAADAHDRIMVRIKRSYRIQVCGTKMRPNGELPSDSPHRHRGVNAERSLVQAEAKAGSGGMARWSLIATLLAKRRPGA